MPPKIKRRLQVAGLLGILLVVGCAVLRVVRAFDDQTLWEAFSTGALVLLIGTAGSLAMAFLVETGDRE